MLTTINGQSHQLPCGTTLSGLIEQLGLDGQRLVVERNRQIVPHDHYKTTKLEEGDVLEIVQFVGGG
ncbi:MAG: thiamine biosynthesis protein ThiS [Desulfuromonas sp.]|nr:MAG: thiamine biosynthesis protein ThiS [Desulfuromonas sp.]